LDSKYDLKTFLDLVVGFEALIGLLKENIQCTTCALIYFINGDSTPYTILHKWWQALN
jgi:hypothetical protein